MGRILEYSGFRRLRIAHNEAGEHIDYPFQIRRVSAIGSPSIVIFGSTRFRTLG